MQINEFLNNPNFYYILGLIATDGHIEKHTNLIKIEIHPKDSDIIYKIHSFFNNQGHVKYHSWHDKKLNIPVNVIMWRMSNNILHQYLNDIGMNNNKTYTINVQSWFDALSDNYKKSFVRGCYDGDGCIYIKPQKINQKRMQCISMICGASKPHIEMIANYFKEFDGHIEERKKEHVPKATCSLYRFCLNSKKSIGMNKIYNINENIDFVLQRKYDSFKKIKNYYLNEFIPHNNKSKIEHEKYLTIANLK